jgi:hypothetical protein
MKRVRGFVHRHVSIEGPDCGKPSVSATGAVTPDFLYVGEEVADERSIDIFDPEFGRWPVPPFARIAEQQPERIAITRNRVRAGL